MKRFFLLAIAFLAALSANAQTKSLLNLDKNGVAIQGYDPVAFFTVGKPVLGKPELASTFNHATYHFATADDKSMFDKDPAKYEPAFGGYCAYGVSRNHLVPIDVEAFQIVDSRLIMQYSKGVRDTFNKDRAGNLSKAEANWPGLVESKGK
jgi:YHS domain-containing protein